MVDTIKVESSKPGKVDWDFINAMFSSPIASDPIGSRCIAFDHGVNNMVVREAIEEAKHDLRIAEIATATNEDAHSQILSKPML